VYNNNNLLVESGGNAFYESGVIEPDVILKDLICILHPHLLPSYRLKYYRKLP
jgi:iron complex transport system substrate-binding protein